MTSLGIIGRLRQSIHPTARRARAGDWRTVAAVRDRAHQLQAISDAGLREQADQLRRQIRAGKSPRRDDIVVPAFACLIESLRRELDTRMYDVQILAGLALAAGAIAEMQTGEGKTLSAALPAFLFSLRGDGVHVIAPNHYLAERDCQSLAPIFARLGARAALLPEQNGTTQSKRHAYAAEITFGTGYEFGFDYLRDQLARLALRNRPLGNRFQQLLRGAPGEAADVVQRGLSVAIVDELDSVLIDEACTPLVIAIGADQIDPAPAAYQLALECARQLSRGEDFKIDLVQRTVTLSEQGLARIHARATTLPALRRAWATYVRQALFAEHLLRRDVDYVINDDRALIVDEFTGRVFADRSWRDGLHQAVAAKEQLPIREETQIGARVSRQRYSRLYPHLCGMTGTAAGSEGELWRLFSLSVVQIPLHRTSRRNVLPTRSFVTPAARSQAIVADIVGMHRRGRPVLVGTRNIVTSEQIAQSLRAGGIPFQLLNGKQDADEASVIAAAGERGAITIATNMAGRGTDIRLQPGVAELGGLHVMGVEFNDSRRIDRQLAGRAGRQGDPGSAQFFVASADDLIARYAPRLAERMPGLPNIHGEITVDLTPEFDRAQHAAEREGRARRQSLLAYDDWLEDVLGKLHGDAAR